MSFDINWESIASDNNISDQLLEFLNDKLGSLELPEYLNGLQVVKFSLGERSPEITIKDVDFPFPEFYSESDGAHSKQQNDYQNSAMQRRQGLHQKTAPLSPTKQSISSRYPQTNFEIDSDLQLTVDLKFDSKIYIEVICNLLVNYPAPEFIKLPVRLKITDLYIHSLAIVAYLEKKLFISFLCDINDDEQLSGRADSVASTTSGLDTRENSQRIDIIKNLRIEGEMGSYEPSNFSVNLANVSNGSILRNIGKIEKFLVSALRGMLISELAWPSWIEL
ncbi:hypothetical protein CANARDRAFT_181755, partial [[Candida] arabinofermentans NRRL YB-2248]